MKQIKAIDFSPKFIFIMKAGDKSFAESLGKDSNYVLFDGFWSEDFPYPRAKDLGRRYYKTFNGKSSNVGYWYANAQVLLQAIERAGSLDSAKVRDAIIGHEFKGTVMGDIKYNEKGIAPMPFTVLQWMDGNGELVFPAVKGSKMVKVAPPWNER